MTIKGWWVSVPGPEGSLRALNKRDFLTSYFMREGTGWQVANEIAKPQVSNSSTHCNLHCKICNRKWKFATGNTN